MSQAVADACAQLNAQGVTVWLRFAWEMNGDWYEWGNDPTNFLTAWKAVTDAVRAKVNDRVKSKTYMLWSPNVRYGEVQSNAGYIPYYPGAACRSPDGGSAARVLRLAYRCRLGWLIILCAQQ